MFNNSYQGMQIVIEPSGEQEVSVRWDSFSFISSWSDTNYTFYRDFSLTSNDVNNSYVQVPYCVEVIGKQ